MAYTLKTTGLATKLIACLGVDEDGVTVKDFKAGNTGTYHASIAAPKTGASTWKGPARNWFKTDYGADAFSPQGFIWSAPLPSLPAVNGFSFFCAAESITDAGAGIFWDVTAGGATGIITSGTSVQTAKISGSLQGSSTTPLPTATKISFGANFKNSGTALQFFYGHESGALAADGTYNDGNFLGTHDLMQFGGSAGLNSKRGRYFIACWFTDTALLTEADFQALHNDWFGTLFEVVTSTTQTNTTTLTLTANATQSASTFTNTTQTATTTLNLTAAATQSYNVTVRQVSTSPDALGHVFGGSAGTPWANLTGINWYWQDTFGGPIIDAGSGASTNASGVLTVNIPNTALANGARGYLSLQVPDVNPAATWPRMLLNLPVTVA